VVHYVLRQWVVWVRGIVTDPVAWQTQWEQASAFMTPRARTMLQDFKRLQKTRLDLGKAVQVEVLNTQALAGTQGRVWEIDWRESAVGQNGYPIKDESGVWHATVKVAQMPAQALRSAADFINPLRVYVEEASIMQRTKGQ
jgi:type IV secretory pathway TrbF-like protein